MEYKGKKIWEEDPQAADSYRQQYVDGIHAYIKRKNVQCKELRRDFMPPRDLAADPEKYRALYRRMLGLDAILEEGCPETKWQYVGSDEICRIYRMTVYITKEIPFYAMLLIPHGTAECPLIIAQHGGWGTPELCCDMNGKNNYNHMVQRVLERGAAVLAPQLMIWTEEEKETARAHPIPFSREGMDRSLKRFGSGITALEIGGIIRCMDAVCEQKTFEDVTINEQKIGMVGLSYGGYFTLHTMAADTRIRAGYTAGCFNDRDIYDWPDWCYSGSALHFQDAEAAALCAPRKLFVQVGETDEVFDYRSALPEIERVYEYYDACGKEENIRFSLWKGGHTIPDEEEGFDFLFSGLEI